MQQVVVPLPPGVPYQLAWPERNFVAKLGPFVTNFPRDVVRLFPGACAVSEKPRPSELVPQRTGLSQVPLEAALAKAVARLGSDLVTD